MAYTTDLDRQYQEALNTYNSTQWVAGSQEQLDAYNRLVALHTQAEQAFTNRNEAAKAKRVRIQTLQEEKAANNRQLLSGSLGNNIAMVERIAQRNLEIDTEIKNIQGSVDLDLGALAKGTGDYIGQTGSAILNDPSLAYGLQKAMTGGSEAPQMNAIRENQSNLAKYTAKSKESEARAAGEAKRNVGAMAGEWTETAANQAANIAAENAGGEAGAGTAIARMQAAQNARNQVGAENIQKAQERKDKYELQQLERAGKTKEAENDEAAAAQEAARVQKQHADGQQNEWMKDYVQNQKTTSTDPTTKEMQAENAVDAAVNNPPNLEKGQQANTNTGKTVVNNATKVANHLPVMPTITEEEIVTPAEPAPTNPVPVAENDPWAAEKEELLGYKDAYIDYYTAEYQPNPKAKEIATKDWGTLENKIKNIKTRQNVAEVRSHLTKVMKQ